MKIEDKLSREKGTKVCFWVELKRQKKWLNNKYSKNLRKEKKKDTVHMYGLEIRDKGKEGDEDGRTGSDFWSTGRETKKSQGESSGCVFSGPDVN